MADGMMDRLILVTGAARSGISLVGGALQLCGAWGGISGRKGSFENERIRDSVIKPFLRGIRADPQGQKPLPDIALCHKLAGRIGPWWRRRIETILKAQGYESGPVYFASALSVLIWPIWEAAFPKARWILVRRDDDEVIRSCMATGYMRAYKTPTGWQHWVDAHKWRFVQMEQAKLNMIEIWPALIVEGSLNKLREAVETLGLVWNGPAVEEFVSPLMWRQGVFEIKRQ